MTDLVYKNKYIFEKPQLSVLLGCPSWKVRTITAKIVMLKVI